MTCIIGIVDRQQNNVIVSADSLGVTDSGQQVALHDKMWRSGDFVFGLAGAVSQSLAVRRIPIPKGESDFDRLYAWLTEASAETGFCVGSRSAQGWSILIAKNGDLWAGGSSRGLVPHTKTGYAAIGSGAPYALGAILALQQWCPNSASDLSQIAMKSACAIDVNSGGDIHQMWARE